MHAVLVARGADVTYCEHNAGHVYEMWANDLPEGLITLLGESDGAAAATGPRATSGD